MDNQVVIALGSNLGQSESIIASAAKRISQQPKIELVALSSIYTSEPALVRDQPLFKNAVMLVNTSLSPQELLQLLQRMETEFGRVREGANYERFGPRTLDLDIIDYEGVVSHNPLLTLPHPEALKREFVVIPLLEISPHHVLANQKVVNTSEVECGSIVNSTGKTARTSSAQDEKGKLTQTTDGWAVIAQTPGLRAADKHVADKGDAATQAASEQSGCLYLCATPIGNLGDITLRVLETLKKVDVVYCEDTRVTHKLTSRYDISVPLKRADAHRLSAVLPTIIDELSKGKQLAYVSDAGMPGISDPGALLVSEVRTAGYAVEVLPGASALTTALATAGIKAHNHYFGGYFPRKQGAGTRLLEKLSQLEDTALVFYESVYRTAKTLRLIAEVVPTRYVVLARELTKLHEEVLSGIAPDLADTVDRRIAGGRALKGEIVILIAPEA